MANNILQGLRESAEGVVKQLPGEWSWEWPHDHCLVATRAEGLSIRFVIHHWDDRITVRPNPPSIGTFCQTLRDWGALKPEEPDLITSFNHEREPGRVAKQIVSKIVGPYETLLPAILERREKRLEEIKQADVTAQAVAITLSDRDSTNLGPESVDARCVSISAAKSGIWGSVEVTPGTNSNAVKLNGLTNQQVQDLADYIAANFEL